MLKKLLRAVFPPPPRVHQYRVTPEFQPQGMSELLNSTALFIISPGRSGTQSLVDFCQRNTTMYCVHAPQPWIASIGYRFHLNEISADAAQFGFYATREPYLVHAFQQQRIFFDGDCKNLPIAPQIGALMPNAKFIHLVRRPQAFIRSGLARGYFDTTPHELWGHLTATRIDSQPAPTLAGRIELVAYFWNEANRIAEQTKRQLGDHRVVTVVAEELFDNPQRAIDALTQLGLGHTIVGGVDKELRALNQQKHRPSLPDEADALIAAAVRERCQTRALYYD